MSQSLLFWSLVAEAQYVVNKFRFSSVSFPVHLLLLTVGDLFDVVGDTIYYAVDHVEGCELSANLSLEHHNNFSVLKHIQVKANTGGGAGGAAPDSFILKFTCARSWSVARDGSCVCLVFCILRWMLSVQHWWMDGGSRICNQIYLISRAAAWTAVTTNQFRANPTKTQVTLFHLRNREYGKQLDISWNGMNLTHCNLPVNVGVTLDRTLSYKAHIEKTKKKVGTRNNIIRKLRTSTFGATPTTLRSSDPALCYSAAEYACPVGNAPRMQRNWTWY